MKNYFYILGTFLFEVNSICAQDSISVGFITYPYLENSHCKYVRYDLQVPEFKEQSNYETGKLIRDSIERILDYSGLFDFSEDAAAYYNSEPCDSFLISDPDDYSSSFDVHVNNSRWLCLSFEFTYDFGGGGHGFGSSNAYFNFDRKQNRFIELDELFKPEVFRVISDSLRISPLDYWRSFGGFSSETPDITGVLVNDDDESLTFVGYSLGRLGVTLYYYTEIMGRGNGVVSMDLSWTMIRPYLRKEFREFTSKDFFPLSK